MGTSKVAIPSLDVNAKPSDSGSAASDRELKESNENTNPGKTCSPEAHAPKPRRASDCGIPRSTPCRASGTGQDKLTTPRGGIIPRETRSSTLRKSGSGIDHNSLRSAGSLTSPTAAGFELTRLRDDLHAKQKEADRLADEIATLKGSVAAKARALAKLTAENEGLNTKLLHAEGSLSNKVRELRDVETERNRLRSVTQDLERQADRLTRKLTAQPKGTGFCEAIATLEAQVKGLKLDNGMLTDDAKGAHNQIRAKDKQLDHMGAEVEEARRIVIQNGELENYILDLRRQLQEASSERATLLNVQRQHRSDMALLTEEKDTARASADRIARELSLCKGQLKASEENSAELTKEAELRKAELTRVMTVASRAVHREASSIKEDGTVPFVQHKEEVMHLKGEIGRLKEKLRLEEKSSAAAQIQLRQLYSKIDALQNSPNKAKTSPRGDGHEGREMTEAAVSSKKSPRTPRASQSATEAATESSEQGAADFPQVANAAAA